MIQSLTNFIGGAGEIGKNFVFAYFEQNRCKPPLKVSASDQNFELTLRD